MLIKNKKLTVSNKPKVVRIIAGIWRKSKLTVLTHPELRPTPDSVRETLFNWLSNLYGIHFKQLKLLDAFAGTGALGFEAASRGALEVLMLEKNQTLYRQLQQTKQRLQAEQIRIEQVDATQRMSNLPEQSFDLVLLDPPFNTSDYPQLIKMAKNLIHSDGLIYVESAQALTEQQLQLLQLDCLKYCKAGAVHAHLLNKIQ